MQTAETNYKRIYGLTVKQIAERIMQREDNIYRIEVIRDILDQYCEECAKALTDGEKLNLSGIGTLTPKIHAPVSMNIFDDEDERKVPYVTVNYHRNNKLKDRMNSRYRKNIENGFAGLSEKCICTTQQRNTLIEKGVMEGEIVNAKEDQ